MLYRRGGGMFVEEKTRQFIFSLCNLYSFSACVRHRLLGCSNLFLFNTMIMICDNAYMALIVGSNDEICRTAWKVAARTAINNTRESKNIDKTPKQILSSFSRYLIENRKEMEKELVEKIWSLIPEKTITSEEKIKIISKLFFYGDEELKALEKIDSACLCYILFQMERMIRINFNVPNHLISEHVKLVENLKLNESYSKLFLPSFLQEIKGDIKQYLPTVLMNIVTKYCSMTIFPENVEDENVIICRILIL